MGTQENQNTEIRIHRIRKGEDCGGWKFIFET